MKVETLIEMMEQEEYQALTCKEFATIVKKLGVLELENKIATDNLEFLKDDWMPKTITHHTNKDKS